MKLVNLMSTVYGRGIRILLGAALIVLGLFLVGGAWGTAIAVVGIVPILAGVFNVCLVAPALGQPFSGAKAAGRA